MPRKNMFVVLCSTAIIIAILSMSGINPETENPPQAPDITPTAIAPNPAPVKKPSYKLCLTDGNLFLYTLDEAGNELERKILDYIDICSLQPYQLDLLTNGASFENREAVARFIQDLDS